MDDFKRIIGDAYTVGEMEDLLKLSSDLDKSLADRINSYGDRLPGIDWDKLNLTQDEGYDKVES